MAPDISKLLCKTLISLLKIHLFIKAFTHQGRFDINIFFQSVVFSEKRQHRFPRTRLIFLSFYTVNEGINQLSKEHTML